MDLYRLAIPNTPITRERAKGGLPGIGRYVVQSIEAGVAGTACQKSKQHDIECERDGEQGEDEGENQPTALPPRRCLARIKIHCDDLPPPGHQVKLTFGASRASGLAMSSNWAGWKPNMFAAMLLGKVSRSLL